MQQPRLRRQGRHVGGGAGGHSPGAERDAAGAGGDHDDRSHRRDEDASLEPGRLQKAHFSFHFFSPLEKIYIQ